MSKNSETRKLARELKRAGWAVRRNADGHYNVTHPETGISVVFANSPSCSRWRLNLRAELKRAAEGRAARGDRLS